MKPCNNCPWRKDAPQGYWHPDHFTDIHQQCRGDGYHVMLCHKSKPNEGQGRGQRIPCAGWIAVEGFDAVGVRMLSAMGMLPYVNTKGIEMFDSMEAMLRANGVDVPLEIKPHYCPHPYHDAGTWFGKSFDHSHIFQTLDQLLAAFLLTYPHQFKRRSVRVMRVVFRRQLMRQFGRPVRQTDDDFSPPGYYLRVISNPKA
jgi:hypothetical protein